MEPKKKHGFLDAQIFLFHRTDPGERLVWTGRYGACPDSQEAQTIHPNVRGDGRPVDEGQYA